jgi:hypothetical protein
VALAVKHAQLELIVMTATALKTLNAKVFKDADCAPALDSVINAFLTIKEPQLVPTLHLCLQP